MALTLSPDPIPGEDIPPVLETEAPAAAKAEVMPVSPDEDVDMMFSLGIGAQGADLRHAA